MSGSLRSVSVLGTTGSVGCSTVDLLARRPGQFRIEALVANRNADRLAEQALKLRPRLAVVADEAAYGTLKEALSGSGIEAASGREAVLEAAALPADWVMAAIVGAAGLEPTLAAIGRGATVALANKESLVCAGALVMEAAARSGAALIPVDSEHSAIFQVFDSSQREMIERIILTASGGPFRTWTLAQMADVSPRQAVAHPNWEMGAKISVDSATMMNKGLELIEAFHLFGLPDERIEILVHPQSVIHSMVGYADGSVLAQMGTPDMRTPIAYALGWPRRIEAPGRRLDFAGLGSLTFEAPDPERFPALALARQALRRGGAAPTILNAANEIAVDAFLSERIGFLDIAALVEEVLAEMDGRSASRLDEVLAVDLEARQATQRRIAAKEK